MATLTLDLYFKAPKPGQSMPPHPVAHIYVKSCSGQEYPKAKGFLFLGAQCIKFSEIDHEIKLLERELKELRARAKRKFAAAEAK